MLETVLHVSSDVQVDMNYYLLLPVLQVNYRTGNMCKIASAFPSLTLGCSLTDYFLLSVPLTASSVVTADVTNRST